MDVFNKNEHRQDPLLDRSAPFMDDSVVCKDGVIKILKGLNPSKALGPVEHHPRVLKELATELGPVFRAGTGRDFVPGYLSPYYPRVPVTMVFPQ